MKWISKPCSAQTGPDGYERSSDATAMRNRMQTSLCRRLARLEKRLWLMGGAGFILTATLLWKSRGAQEALLTGLALAFAVAPGGLTAMVRATLGQGAKAMHISAHAAETLSALSVLCADKADMLTQGHASVAAIAAPLEPMDARDFIRQPSAVLMATAMTLCHGKEEAADGGAEAALLAFAAKHGYTPQKLEKRMTRVDESLCGNRLTTVHTEGKALRTFTRGTLEEVLPLCNRLYDGGVRVMTDEDRARVTRAAGEMADAALETLCFAMGQIEHGQAMDENQELVFLGTVGLLDPPRTDAREAVAGCLRAGIKPVMMTEDHLRTAAAIGRELGLLQKGDRAVTGEKLAGMKDDRLREEVRNIAVYARISPEQRARVVKAWQSYGEVVAVCGGQHTEQADMRAGTGDDAELQISGGLFEVMQGVARSRGIFHGALGEIQFALSCHVALTLLLGGALLLGYPNPLPVLALLWTLLTAVLPPALGLGREPAEPEGMTCPPREAGKALRGHALRVRTLYQGTMLGLLALAGYRIGLISGAAEAKTMALAVATLSFALNALNVRSSTRPVWAKNEKFRWLDGAAAISILLQLALLLTPLAQTCALASLSGAHWLVVAALACSPIALVECLKALGWTGDDGCKRE